MNWLLLERDYKKSNSRIFIAPFLEFLDNFFRFHLTKLAVYDSKFICSLVTQQVCKLR